MDITILAKVTMKKGGTGRVYYYAGNIYQPLSLHKREEVRVRRAITNFKIANADLMARDQAAPGYRTLVELHDDQVGQYA